MSKNDRLAKRLTEAEERNAAADGATQGLDEDHLTAVGVVVAAGAASVPVFYAFQGSAVLAVATTTATLKAAVDIAGANGGDQPDASDLLTALLCAGPEQVMGSIWADGVVVAGHLATTDSALLLDPEQRTVTMYRPRESAEKPLGVWGFADWPAVTSSELETPFSEMMQPGYSSVWQEAEAAQQEVFAARKALEVAIRPRLALVTT